MGVVFRHLVWIGALAACAGDPPKRAEEPDQLKTTSLAEERCLTEAAASPERKADEPGSVTVKHILVKHAEAERAEPSVKRSRGQACVRALEVIERLKGGDEFDALVSEFSEEAGAATRAGMLGAIKRDEVEPAFAAAAFALDVGQVSNVVETKFGFHVILRAE
jgi:parvulin-like peptidyl-prolyl isomerase